MVKRILSVPTLPLSNTYLTPESMEYSAQLHPGLLIGGTTGLPVGGLDTQGGLDSRGNWMWTTAQGG